MNQKKDPKQQVKVGAIEKCKATGGQGGPPGPPREPFSRPWMAEFLDDAIHAGDVSGALKRVGITLLEYHSERARDPAFGTACLALDQTVKLTIRSGVEIAAAGGDLRAVRLLAQGLGQLGAKDEAWKNRARLAQEVADRLAMMELEGHHPNASQHWYTEAQKAGIRWPEDAGISPQIAEALRRGENLPPLLAAAVELAWWWAHDLLTWDPETPAEVLGPPGAEGPCPWCGCDKAGDRLINEAASRKYRRTHHETTTPALEPPDAGPG